MSAARDRILASIGAALGRTAPLAALDDEPDRGRGDPTPNTVPARGRLARKQRIALFQAEAERVDATTERVDGLADVPGRVAAYLTGHNLPKRIRVTAEPLIVNIAWDKEPLLTLDHQADRDSEVTSVTAAVAAVAETGTLVLCSGDDAPTAPRFLAKDHIVILTLEQIFGVYEEVWRELRLRAGGRDFMPRVVNWITGPSRTADIEQSLLLGAHGPERLHIIIVDSGMR